MSHLNETIIPFNNSGLDVIPTTYTNNKLVWGGYVDFIRLEITTASGIANNGSLWLGESGTSSLLLMTSLTGTTTHDYYPRRNAQNSSGTDYDGTSGLNSLLNYVIPSNAVAYIAGSGIGSGTNLSVGGNVRIFWHKP